MTESTTVESQSRALRRKYLFEVLAVWMVLGLISTIRIWPRLLSRSFRDPDDAARLVQTRELLAGHSWWDLSFDRIGFGDVEMHWSRHIDGALVGITGVLRPLIGEETAELVAIIAVPLGLLLAALWFVSSLARVVFQDQDVGLYAMIVLGFGVGVLPRLGPGGLDHHGLQIVLVLLMARMIVGGKARASALVGGVAAGLSLSVGLETLPMVLAVLVGVGIGWAVGVQRERSFYSVFGVGLVATSVISSFVFGPSGRLLSNDCDVFSLGFFMLVAAPALGIALLGGRSWSKRRAWGALSIMAGAGLTSFVIVNPACVSGPYGAMPTLVHRIWIDLIVETRGLIGLVTDEPLYAIGVVLGPVLAVAYLVRMIWIKRRHQLIPLLAVLATALLFGIWQIRTMPLALALAAPVLGGLVVRLRDVVSKESLRVGAAFAAALVVSGFPFVLASESASQEDDSAGAQPCITSDLLDGLGGLKPGLVAAEMNFGPAILLHTEHRVLASPYHRAYEGVVATYDLFTARADVAAEVARSLGVAYVVVCDKPGIDWHVDNPDGLLVLLLADRPPEWAEKVIDTGNSRIYALAPGS